jgi:hypothetical protein
LEVGEPLLKEPQGSAVPPRDFDGFIEQPGGENNGKMGTAMESHRDFVPGDGDFGRHVDEIAENLARLGIVVAAHRPGGQARHQERGRQQQKLGPDASIVKVEPLE